MKTTDRVFPETVTAPAGGYRCALFDFDGTVSLIRAGWQQVMVPYFCDELAEAAPGESAQTIRAEVRGFVDALTGKQTIYQCMALAEAVARRGGAPKTPGAYKAEYLRRLDVFTAERKRALETGKKPPEALSVPGAIPFLRRLREAGLRLYLASGTDETDVRREAALLGVADLFDGGIHGAREDLTDCSKEAVIGRLLRGESLPPAALLGFGDGVVEIGLVRNAGGYAVGVADDELSGGLDEEKRLRLLRAGAGMIIPDFSEPETLLRALHITS